MEHALCIINPAAGTRGRGRRLWRSLEPVILSRFFVETHYTRRSGDAGDFVKDHYKGKDCVICIGGDGTLHEVAASIVKNNIELPILYIPAGTADDIGRTLSAQKSRSAVKKIISNYSIRQLDAGILNNSEIFAYVAAFGAFAHTASRTSQKAKNRLGYPAYFFAGLKSLRGIRPVQARVTIESQETSGEFLLGLVCNTTSIGGGFIRLRKKDVDLCDGKLEVLLVRYPKNIFAAAGILFGLLARKYEGKRFVFAHATHVNISLDGQAPWTIDGELTEHGGDVEIMALNKKVRVLG